jgi:hypothetical protein
MATVTVDINRDARHTLKEIESFRINFDRERSGFTRNVKNGDPAAIGVFRRAKRAVTALAAFVKRHPALSVLVIVALAFGTGARAGVIALDMLHDVTLPGGMTPRDFWTAYWPWAKTIVPTITNVKNTTTPAAAAKTGLTAWESFKLFFAKAARVTGKTAVGTGKVAGKILTGTAKVGGKIAMGTGKVAGKVAVGTAKLTGLWSATRHVWYRIWCAFFVHMTGFVNANYYHRMLFINKKAHTDTLFKSLLESDPDFLRYLVRCPSSHSFNMNVTL